MRYVILFKVIKQSTKGDESLQKYVSPFNTDSNKTVGELKEICFSKIKDLNNLTKVSEDFWVNENKITDNNQIISSTNGLEYDLYVN
jgi:ABC-type enterochelin transport system substrate-binding protein